MMAAELDRLVWVDMEMTGLEPDQDHVLELAIVVTDAQLNTVVEAPVLVIHQSAAVLESMDDWNKNTHGQSGLIERVRVSEWSEATAEAHMLAFLAAHVPAKVSPMCGNSIGQDRRFMARWMPKLEAFFHYRNVDVSTLKELARRWRPELLAQLTKQSRHEALADIYESIDELKFYRQHFMVV